eukprot:GHVQ01017566.1.p2 GENE.GHVQ01017566.1~~GHVQ01017566.1.p2  ORF type:complete len:246 (+),score=28.74 GHVQ01017566.1:1468-2205(+)
MICNIIRVVSPCLLRVRHCTSCCTTVCHALSSGHSSIRAVLSQQLAPVQQPHDDLSVLSNKDLLRSGLVLSIACDDRCLVVGCGQQEISDMRKKRRGRTVCRGGSTFVGGRSEMSRTVRGDKKGGCFRNSRVGLIWKYVRSVMFVGGVPVLAFNDDEDIEYWNQVLLKQFEVAYAEYQYRQQENKLSNVTDKSKVDTKLGLKQPIVDWKIVNNKLDCLIKTRRIVVFIKGSPDRPRCKFSKKCTS